MPTSPTSRPKADPTFKKRALRPLNSGPTHSRDLIVPSSAELDLLAPVALVRLVDGTLRM